MDVESTPVVFNAMRSSAWCSSIENQDYCVDTVPVVQGKAWFYNHHGRVSVDRSEVSSTLRFAEEGDVIGIQLVSRAPLSSEIQASFTIQRAGGSDDVKVLATLIATWTVRHICRQAEESLLSSDLSSVSESDRNIVSKFSFCSYSSPADERTAPQRAQKWSTWRKPVLKPGDVVALLRPSRRGEIHGRHANEEARQRGEDEPAAASRLCLVHRFWAENGEQDRHLFCLPENEHEPASPVDRRPPRSDREDDLADVASTTLVATCRHERGPQKHSPVSSFGNLSSGEMYFIYRI